MLACRPMLCFAVAIMGGVLAARQHPGIAAGLFFGWIGFGLCLGAFLLAPVRKTEPSADIPPSYAAHILPRPGFLARRGLNRFILVVCLGLFLAGCSRQLAWRERLNPERLPAEKWFRAALVALEPSRPYEGETGRWRVAALLYLVDGNGVDDIPVQLQGSGEAAFRRGDVLHARVRRLAVSPRAYPGAFDFAFFVERSGAVATLEIADGKRDGRPRLEVAPVDSPPAFTRVRRFVDDVRGKAIALTLNRGGDEGGMLAAMLYGYRKDTAEEIRDAFRRVGIGHVLAISGLHVGLVVGLLWWLGGLTGWPRRTRALGCLVLAVFYLGLTGGQVAATRATLMAVIHLAGIARGRRGDMLNSLGAAAFFIVLANPTAPLDVSFQLSFTAVVFIYMALRRSPDGDADGTRQRRSSLETSWRARAAREFRSLVRLSAATWIGLFPIIAVVFNQVNLVGLPINIVVIPLMSLVLAGGLLLPWLGWIPGMSRLLTLPAKALTETAMFCDAIPGSSFAAHAPPMGWTLVFYLFAALLMLGPMLRSTLARRRWNMAAIAGIVLGTIGLIAGMASRPPPPEGRIAILPGRGMGTLVAEAPGGGIGLLGEIRRGGVNEAGWLHYLRRGGSVGVVAVGRPTERMFDALAYHYPVGGLTGVRPSKKAEAGFVSPWLPVPGAEGVEYCYRRDGNGRIFWLSARTGGKAATISTRVGADVFAGLLRGGAGGSEAELFSLSFSEKAPALPEGFAPGGRVGVRGRIPANASARFFRRNDYGALVSGRKTAAFDGAVWRALPDGEPASRNSVSPATASAVPFE